MPRYMCTLFINYATVGNVGWSESYPLLQPDMVSVLTQWANILNGRKTILGTDAFIVGDRVSDTDVKQDSIPSNAVFPIAGAGPGVCFPQFDIGLRVKVTDASFTKRGNRWYRGIPTTEFTAGNYAPTPAFNTALAAWEGVLTTANLCIASRIHGAVAPPFFNYFGVTTFFPPVDDAKKTGRPFGLRAGRRIVA